MLGANLLKEKLFFFQALQRNVFSIKNGNIWIDSVYGVEIIFLTFKWK